MSKFYYFLIMSNFSLIYVFKIDSDFRIYIQFEHKLLSFSTSAVPILLKYLRFYLGERCFYTGIQKENIFWNIFWNLDIFSGTFPSVGVL